ncbi:MAG TPA: TIR domain-containing protein [Pyrinomonadaceae bacterium]
MQLRGSFEQKQTAGQTKRPDRKNTVRYVSRLLFGDDVFISYSRQDASAYSLDLANQLTQRELSCFLDQWGAPAGKDIPEKVLQALKRSSMFVLLGSPGAAHSSQVEKELREFRKTGRAIIPISFEGALRTASWYKELVEGISISQELNDALETGLASQQIITRIVNAENFTRRNKRLRRYLGLIVLSILIVLLAGAFIAGSLLQQARAGIDSARAEAFQAQQDRENAQKDLESIQLTLSLVQREQKEAEDRASDAIKKEAKAAANAKQQERNAQEQRKIADEQTKRGEHLRYSGDMQSAQQSYLANDTVAALQVLGSYLPQSSSGVNQAAKLRGFEWHYLWQLLDRDSLLRVQNNLDSEVLIVSPNGTTIGSIVKASEKGTSALWLWDRNKTKTPIIFQNPSLQHLKSIAFSPNAELLATTSEKTISLWKVSSLISHGSQVTKQSEDPPDALTKAPPLAVIQEERNVETVVFGANSNVLMIVSTVEKNEADEETFPFGYRFLNAWTRKNDSSNYSLSMSARISGEADKPTLSPDGTFLVLHNDSVIDVVKLPASDYKGGSLEIAQLWVPGSGRTARQRPVNIAVSFSPKSQVMAIGAGTRAWILDPAKLMWGSGHQVVADIALLELKFRKDIVSFALSPDGTDLVVNDGETLSIWDLTPSRESLTLDYSFAGPKNISATRRNLEPTRQHLAHFIRLNPWCAMDFISHGARFVSICPNRGVHPDEMIIRDVDNDLTLNGVSLWETASWKRVSLSNTADLTAWMNNKLAYDHFSNNRPLAGYSDNSDVLAIAKKGLNGKAVISVRNLNAPQSEISISTGIDFAVLNQVELAPDGRTLALQVFGANEIQIFNTQSGARVSLAGAGCEIKKMEKENSSGPITGVTFSANSKKIALLRGHRIQTIELWEVSPRPKCIQQFSSGESHLNKLLFINDDRSLVIVHQNPVQSVNHPPRNLDSVAIWDVHSPEPKLLSRLVEREQFAYATVSPNGRILATCSTSESNNVVIKLWDTKSRTLLGLIRLQNRPTAELDSSVHDFRGKPFGMTFIHQKNRYAYAAFSSDSRTIAIYGVDDTVRLYSTANSQLMLSLKDKAGIVNIAFSPDNGSLLTLNEKGELKLWLGTQFAEDGR